MRLRYFKIAVLFIFLGTGGFIQPSLAKKAKQKWEHFLQKRGKEKAPLCKKLSMGCAICSDGKMYVPTRKGSKVTSKRLNVSPYVCANSKGPVWNDKRIPASKLKEAYKNGCRILSDFCAVCKDNSYIFIKNGIKIDTDLYACATSPRTRIYKQ